METIRNLRNRAGWGFQSRDMNFFSDYYRKAASRDPTRFGTKDLRDIPSILKNAMSFSPKKMPISRDEEIPRPKIENHSLIKALQPQTEGLSTRNQESVLEFKDLADITDSDKENNGLDSSDIQINYTEVPFFMANRSKFDENETSPS